MVADLWGNVATPSATVSILHAPPAASVSNDRDKVGFTLDVTQRLGGAIAQESPAIDVTPIAHRASDDLADSA